MGSWDEIMGRKVAHQFDALVRENQRLLKQLEKAKTFEAVVKDAVVSSVSKLRPMAYQSVEEKKGDEEVALLTLSDIHFGERVLPVETVGLNDYNFEIAKARLDALFQRVLKVTDIQRRLYPIPKIVIALLGDVTTGECIYPGQGYYIDRAAMDQAFQGAHLLAQFFNRLSEYYDQVEIQCVRGNHGRPAPKGVAHNKSNWDTVLYRMMEKELLSCKRIEVVIHDGLIGHTEINNRIVAFSHGDTLGRGCLVETAMGRAATQWPDLLRNELRCRHLDLCLFGHYHSSASLQIGSMDVFANGSIVGGTSFSANNIRRINPPRQWFLGIHPKRVTWQYALSCEE